MKWELTRRTLTFHFEEYYLGKPFFPMLGDSRQEVEVLYSLHMVAMLLEFLVRWRDTREPVEVLAWYEEAYC